MALLLEALTAHQPVDERETDSRSRFLAALERLPAPFDAGADATHVTASAVVVGSQGVLLHRHKRLGLWLQPGGHLEDGETPAEAALREAAEETGLPVRHWTPGGWPPPGRPPALLHVDVHPGPLGHTHLDTRFLVRAPDRAPTPPPGESPAARWFAFDEAFTIADPGLLGALERVRQLLA